MASTGEDAMAGETARSVSGYDLVFRDATLVDGTGAPRRAADVAIAGDVVAAVAAPKTLTGARTVEAAGKTLAPGFVDIHSHGDYTLLLDGRAHSAVLQGVTSIVVGNCGHGIAPVSAKSVDLVPMNIPGWMKESELPVSWRSFRDYLALMRDRGVGANVYPLVAHGALRLAVSGFADRALDRGEIAAMRREVETAMASGAVGMSSGLEYAPGIAADTEELAAVAEGMRATGGVYATHCRNRSDAMDKAAEEAVAIARRGTARLQLSHFVRRPYAEDDVVARAWRILDDADASDVTVRCDVFPFDYGPTPLSVLIPPAFRDGTRADVAARLRDPATRKKIYENMGGMFEAAVKHGLVDGMYVAADGRDGALVGKSLAEVAKIAKLPVAEAALWLLEQAGENFYTVTIVENWVRWAHLLEALSDPRFFLMGDGVTSCLNGPLAGACFSLSDWGYAPRFLSDFVRDSPLVPLEAAIARMTDGPARQIGLTDRGRIASGLKADLVLFDLKTVGSAVKPNDLCKVPMGIDSVVVNGAFVVDGGRATDARPGVVGLHR
jgi:N-acyl-D-aspartate/D-glutamate deacylase